MERLEQIEKGIYNLEKIKVRKSFNINDIKLDLIINDMKYLFQIIRFQENEIENLNKEVKKLKTRKTNKENKEETHNDKVRNKN